MCQPSYFSGEVEDEDIDENATGSVPICPAPDRPLSSASIKFQNDLQEIDKL
jgi:hypothetical protein